ncbi:MAG: hypothetical protein WA941_08190 [Nitrososphaeraceae archaeon]
MAYLSDDYRRQQQWQQEGEEQPRIFDVTEGLKSPQSKQTYRLALYDGSRKDIQVSYNHNKDEYG